MTIVPSEGLAEDAVMIGESVAVALGPEKLEQLRRPLNVCEQKRDRPNRQSVPQSPHHSRITTHSLAIVCSVLGPRVRGRRDGAVHAPDGMRRGRP